MSRKETMRNREIVGQRSKKWQKHDEHIRRLERKAVDYQQAADQCADNIGCLQIATAVLRSEGSQSSKWTIDAILQPELDKQRVMCCGYQNIALDAEKESIAMGTAKIRDEHGRLLVDCPLHSMLTKQATAFYDEHLLPAYDAWEKDNSEKNDRAVDRLSIAHNLMCQAAEEALLAEYKG